MSGLIVKTSVRHISDDAGNAITSAEELTFRGSNLADVVAPKIIRRTPEPGSVGAVATHVIIEFSEPVVYYSAFNGVRWWSDGSFVFDFRKVGETSVILTPQGKLPYGALQTITVHDVQDEAGNVMQDAEWTFAIANEPDAQRPTIVSTSPANLATHIDRNASVSVTFSEPIDQYSFFMDVLPYLGQTDMAWSNGGKTVTVDPLGPLSIDQQYLLNPLNNTLRDLSGNLLERMPEVVFSTGGSIAEGRIHGHVTGDPGSSAANPKNTLVLAEPDTTLTGFAYVTHDLTYEVSHLPDGTYSISALMDTNANGILSVYEGDAFGAYGVNVSASDYDLELVSIFGGNTASGIDFPMHDPSAVGGGVWYSGEYSSQIRYVGVGLFDASTFDPANPGMPTASTGCWFPFETDWDLNTIDQPVPEGYYYVGAYLDANASWAYESGIDPFGIYGEMETPEAVLVKDGKDHHGIFIMLHDAISSGTTAEARWPDPKVDPGRARLYSALEQFERLR